MKLKETKFDVGVIVGRFQVHKLHEAHIDLIEDVSRRHPKVIIFLGVPPTLATRDNPLDFETRKMMIVTRFPKVIVLPVNDHSNDVNWSKNLDRSIGTVIPATQSVVLYGGRDSFKPHYHGRFPVLEFENEGYFSGTESRREASIVNRDSEDFRAGVISGVYNQFPKVFTTVDIAIFNKSQILLAQKEGESLLRFVGGFAEPDSECFEDDAAREVQEETGLEVSRPIYVGSKKVEDWRYRKCPDKVKTILFLCDYIFGAAEAKDDIVGVKWVEFQSLKESDIVLEHRHLFAMLKVHPEVLKRISMKGEARV